MNNPAPVDPSPLPSNTAVGTAAAASAVLGYGALWASQKYGIPPEVAGGVLTLLSTFFTSLWHKAQSPAPNVK